MIGLPPALDAYFSLPKQDTGAALDAIFLDDARVHDERQDHRGLEAIKAWRREVNEKTPYDSKVLSWEDSDGAIVVTAEISGSFPGSPVTLDHRFQLKDGKIADLEIG